MEEKLFTEKKENGITAEDTAAKSTVKLKKVMRNGAEFLKDNWFKLLITLIGTCLLVYFTIGIHGEDFISKVRISFDMWVPALIGAIVLLILYLSGMVRDFLNGFRLAITRKKDIPLEKIQRAVEAVSCAERTAVAAGLLCLIADTLDMLSSFYIYESLEDFWSICDVPLGILTLEIIYPTLFLLVLTPVKARLKLKIACNPGKL